MINVRAGTVDSVSISLKREKLVWDGMVAVIVHHDYGGGWASNGPGRMFDPELAELILEYQNQESKGFGQSAWDNVNAYLKKKYNETISQGKLAIRWVPQGTQFFVDEYDGWECVILEHEVRWTTA